MVVPEALRDDEHVLFRDAEARVDLAQRVRVVLGGWLPRADVLRGEDGVEGEAALERGAGVGKGGAVDVAEHDEFVVGGERGEGGDGVGEGGPVLDGVAEGGGGLCVCV